MPGSWERSCLTARSTVRFSRTLPSLPLWRVFCCPPRGPIERPAMAGTRDPDLGARAAKARAHARGACRRERGDEPDTDGRANPDGSQHAARRQRRDRISVTRFAAGDRGSTDAGGEDVGYFSTRHSGYASRLWHTHRDAASEKVRTRPGAGLVRKDGDCVVVTESRYRPFPSVPINGRCESIGLAVVKMPVTSW